MLDTDTKRRIDTARDILVGKVPDPKSQVEQITIALIYKFMDDMDAESEELGGKRTFFAGEYVKYGWAKLMAVGIEGHEMLGLYAEGIARMPENMGIPQLFRDIFKNAYLPYRDPETLKSFLKIINEFSYDHSERLGDAFEYLLSVLGSQGDAGQFRTPRHIIDFMVEVMQPRLGEVVLDPACGTAGFLISAYKHILQKSVDDKGVSTLTPNARKKLATNFKGYDISPDMVRLSRANLYLHGFLEPQIYEYDTLTSDERWNESADVVLANPPFMSPKGGIKPHKRFSIQAKRSEVLFVDYIAEHLSPQGRAAIIVPEGIIFQSQGAYKDLRKMLVENSLVAVISLPAGVFQPYSGVKTSILILDKTLAKQAEGIAFFKIENDGFGLGAQRRAIAKNDLPNVEKALGQYLQGLRANNGLQALSDMASEHGMVVNKDKIALSGDYNLSGERYRESTASTSSFPLVPLTEICLLQRGLSYTTPELGEVNNGVPFYNLKSIKRQGTPQQSDFKYFVGEIKDKHFVATDDILIALTDLTPTSELIGSPKLITDSIKAAYSADLGKLVFKTESVQPRFVYHLLRSKHYRDYIVTYSSGANVKHLQSDGFYALQIPLPPLDIQKQIVAEIEGYQKVIDGARAVVDNYRPRIDVQADWPMVALGEVCSTSSGGTPLRGQAAYYENGKIPWLRSGEVAQGEVFHSELFITEAGLKNSSAKLFPKNTVLIAMYGATAGEIGILRFESATNQAVCGLTPNEMLSPDFLHHFLKTIKFELVRLAGGGAQPNISQKIIREFKIPLPPLPIQQSIVAEIEAEQGLVAANREVIVRFEKKIAAVLARVWGE